MVYDAANLGVDPSKKNEEFYYYLANYIFTLDYSGGALTRRAWCPPLATTDANSRGRE